ncbi:MAG: [FeFe] hydrogenase H-cluster maturation GTPase HydF, partial [Clostridia bacterium]|nr:[FeFe] hydrogenase H-cluster maturation GTPase HydF [Clostridia bacterium]
PIKGTTTDPVKKAMELIPFGPVVFIDTAGLDDSGELGIKRAERSKAVIKQTDFALFVLDGAAPDDGGWNEMKALFERYQTPYMLVINKIDEIEEARTASLVQMYPGAQTVSAKTGLGLENLRQELAKRLQADEKDETLLGDLLPGGAKVILVVPVDSEAPKGRLILPQVQVIRDCLDHGIKSYVVRDSELESALKDIPDVDLVVTDSQAFAKVNVLVPAHLRLTSFSMLFARQKGDFKVFLEGAKAIDRIKPGDKVLVAESCTHNHTHEDIGRIKIPKLLNNYLGFEVQYDFFAGNDFPQDIKKYAVVVQCGACMVNKRSIHSRLMECQANGVAITNYGILLSKLNGILDRTVEVFRQSGL